MFQKPQNYTENDHFFFQADSELEKYAMLQKIKMVF